MKRSKRGFSLIELLIALAIMGILLALAAPSYRTWIANTRIRTTAESIQNGLQLARAEAVRRNAQIRFQFTDSIVGSCVLSTTVSNWIVSYDDPAGDCAAALLNEAFPVSDVVNNPAPRIIRVRAAAEGSRTVDVAAGQAVYIFNGLGQVTNLGAAAGAGEIKATPDATVGVCKGSIASTSSIRCLSVLVSRQGQIRMCDPYLTLISPADPQAC